MSSIEKIILSNLICTDSYARKVIPFLKAEYFQDRPDQLVFNLITEYVGKYTKFPSKEALFIDLSNKTGLNEQLFGQARDLIRDLEADKATGEDWLLENTEKFCKDGALFNAVMTAVNFVDKGQKHDISAGELPEILSKALGVSFDTNIGHDFITDAEARYDLYQKKEYKIPFDLDYLNRITKGGVSRKTLNVFMAVTGVGKSLVMCHMAAANLLIGKNVLYLTLEMSEEKIAERIDANLLNVELDRLPVYGKEKYLTGINKIQQKTNGKLIIKEYPPGGASVVNFRHLLSELKLKKKFVPDIIYVDYLNLCASSRVKMGGSINTYTYVKWITEEVRGLAVEYNLPIVSATQTNRGGVDNSDPGMGETSESFGLPQTVDLFLALISSENLENLNQILVKQLKNRYGDINRDNKFIIGVDKSKMKLYDTEQISQLTSSSSSSKNNKSKTEEDKPLMDKTKFGMEDSERVKPALTFGRSKAKKKSLFEGMK